MTSLRMQVPGRSWVLAIALVVAVSSLVGLALLIEHTSYDVWGALVVGPALLLLTLPLARWAARIDSDPTLVRFLLLALLAKFAGSLARYYTVYVLYDGAADANRYDRAGRALATSFREGVLTDLGEISGTRFLDIVTGGLYALIGPSNLGGFLVFSWGAFLGLFLFYRAFRLAFPDGDHRRYRLLLFFLPSLLFWPSSIGKEALMLLFLGACAYGLARLLAHRRWGFVWLSLGLWGAVVVRPHMALVLLAGAAPALVVRRTHNRSHVAKPTVPVANLVLAVVVLGAAVVVASRAEQFFGIEDLNASSAEEVLVDTEAQTSQGGSEFDPPNPQSPFGYATALVTVLFRPFPFEARNAVALLSAAEGVVLLALLVASRRRLVRVLRLFFEQPYVIFVVTYTAVFVYLFSVFSNFGILARQRTQLFPLLLVLLAISARTSKQEEVATRAEAALPSRPRGSVASVG